MIRNADRRLVWEFMHDRLGLHNSEDFRGVMFVHDRHSHDPMVMDHVGVAVGYNNFVGRTCCMHSVIQEPELVSRSMIREVFEYPFVTCGCEAIIALVDSSNEKAMKFDLKLGFKEATRIKGAGVDGDLVVLVMRRDDCRWIKKEH